ncbi:ORF5 [Broome virga-like virus 1]|nr:ORF5 [Broome virga-like virus 1]
MPSIPASVLYDFVVCSLKTQVDIAKRVRDIQNADYILFDPSFRRTHRIRIGDYRVEVDAMGRKAVTCAAAKEVFDVDDYWQIVREFDCEDIILHHRCIALRAKPVVKSRSKLSIDIPPPTHHHMPSLSATTTPPSSP